MSAHVAAGNGGKKLDAKHCVGAGACELFAHAAP